MTTEPNTGAIVVSLTTGARVRVTQWPDGEWFTGTCIGNELIPEMPPQFHYSWHEWRKSNFVEETH